MTDTLEATFAKHTQGCEHGKGPGVFCQKCHEQAIKDSRQSRRDSQAKLDWADFHDNVLNS